MSNTKGNTASLTFPSFRRHLLFDFDADIDLTFDLTKTLRIRRITKQEKFCTFDDDGKSKEGYGLGEGNRGRLFFVAECSSYGNPKHELDRLATVLLLFKREPKEGALPTFSIEFGGKGNLESGELQQIHTNQVDQGHNQYSGYFLSANELPSFTTFWNASTSVKWHDTLVVASQRLLRMQSRAGTDSYEDRLIDIMIAFEALVLKREDNKGSMIAHRGAGLLDDSKRHIERRLKLAYTCRNDLVHDGCISKKVKTRMGMPLDKFVSQTECDLRSSMAKYVELMNTGKTRKSILQDLGSPVTHKPAGKKK